MGTSRNAFEAVPYQQSRTDHQNRSKSILLFLCLLVGLVVGDAPYPSDVASNSILSNYPAPSPDYTKWEGEPDQSFNIQSGYEGYLVPSEPPFSFSDFLRTAGILTILPPLSKIGIKLAFKFGIWALGFIALFLIGSLVTSTVCTFTPICTISFLGLGFNRESVRSLLTQDRLNTATKFLSDAIKKYKEMNKKKEESGKSN